MSYDETKHRRGGNPTNTGEYSAKANSMPQAGILHAYTVGRAVMAPVRVKLTEFSLALPKLPEGASTPTVTYGTDDATGGLYIAFESEARDVIASYDHFDEAWQFITDGWDDDFDEYVPWATEICDRIEQNDSALVGKLREANGLAEAVIASALGEHPEPEEKPAPERAVERASRMIPAWHGDDEEPETMVSDILTDLRHYMDANGLDFDAAIESSARMAADEVRDPDF